MRLLIDMNLPPAWVSHFAARGFEAVHWSTIGAPTAVDEHILAWARTQGFVVLTHDLDFSAILAAGGDEAPSVVQLRTQDLLSAGVVDSVAAALAAHADDILSGALISINETGTRIRMLPLRRR